MIRLAYDHLGRRIAKTVWVWLPGVNGWRLEKDLRYVYDGWQMIAELDHTFAPPTYGWQPTQTWGGFDLYLPTQRQAVQAGFGGFTGISGVAAERSVVRSYLWGQDLSGTMTGAGGVGGLLSVTHQGVTYHTCADANGNLTGLLAANGEDAGKLVARFDYDPFGNRITNTGPDVEICPMGFSSKYTDSETGLVDYGLRIYSPMLGRFASRDPIEESGGVNLYGFVGNDPVNKVDVLGREAYVILTDAEVVAQITQHWLSPNGNTPFVRTGRRWNRWMKSKENIRQLARNALEWRALEVWSGKAKPGYFRSDPAWFQLDTSSLSITMTLNGMQYRIAGTARKHTRTADKCDCIGFTNLSHELRDNVVWHPEVHPNPDRAGQVVEDFFRGFNNGLGLPPENAPAQGFPLHIYSYVNTNSDPILLCRQKSGGFEWFVPRQWPAVKSEP